MEISQLYWLITLPKIGGGVGTTLSMIGFIGVSLIGAAAFITDGDSWKDTKKWLASFIAAWCVGGMLTTFIPTTKEIIAIYGFNYITNEKSLTEIPPKLFEYANITLDDLIDSAQEVDNVSN